MYFNFNIFFLPLGMEYLYSQVHLSPELFISGIISKQFFAASSIWIGASLIILLLIIMFLRSAWKRSIRKAVANALSGQEHQTPYERWGIDENEDLSIFNQETIAFLKKRYSYPVPALVNRPGDYDEKGNLSLTTIKYREFSQVLPDVVLECNAEGKILFMNNVGHRLLEVDPSTVKEKELKVYDFIHPEDIPAARKNIALIFQDLPSSDDEYRIVKNGKIIMHALAYAIPVIRNGRMIGLRILLADISVKKKTEETIRIIQDIFSHIGFGILVFALDQESNPGVFKLEVINETSSRLMKFANQQNIGKTITELSPLLNQLGLNKIFENVLQNGQYCEIDEFEYQPDPSISARSLHLRVFPLPQNRVVLLMEDITNRKNAEKTLKMNDFGIEHAGDLIFWIDENARLIFANGTSCRMYGYSKEQIKELSISEIDARISTMQWFEIVQILENKQTLVMESIHKTHDGDSFPVEMSINKFSFDGKKYYFVLVRDISERKKNDELEQKIQVARKSAAVKQQFLANMSHEIRTPMTGIMGMTSLLMRTQLSPAQQEYVRNIKISSENLLNIINDVLDLSKIEAGKMELKPNRISLRDFVADIKEIFQHQAQAKGLRFTTSIDPGIPSSIIVDDQRLKQVVNNLLSNAFKFTDDGEISVRFLIEQQKGQEVILRCDVMDTGMGISEENQRQVFEKFTQVDTSLIRPFEGTGLGLAICRELTNLLGGDISVTSVLNQGSTFSFTFKARFDENDMETPSQLLKKDFLNMDISVLHVEDKLLNQKVVGFILFNAGCNVDFVKNGLEAIEKYSPGKYDIILMDIQMPVLDGISAYHELKRLHGDKLCPVIGLSANAMEGDEQKFLEMGLDDYIVKPFQPHVLYEKLLKWAGKLNKS
jgi:PAS domain S-box-containing protein